MPARLTVVRGRDADQVFRIEDSHTTSLGRSVKCDVRVPDAKASRAHCCIERIGDAWAITDADSRNGTFVNRERIRQCKLNSGDVIRIGGTVYKFSIDGQPDANAFGGTEVLVEPESSGFVRPEQQQDLGADLLLPDEEDPDIALEADDEPVVCAQCGRPLPPDAAARGDATEIGGRLFCRRCVVDHTDSGPVEVDDAPVEDSSESSEIQSLLQSLERVTEADRLGSSPPPTSPDDAPEPPKKRPGLLDRLRGKKPDD